jgi:hypothetical protein
MSCEKYQYALIDLAASGAELTGDVRAHLDACASCRSYFEREKVLLAGIESGVRHTTNAPLPASLLHHLRARLAHQAPANLNPTANWTYAVLVVAAVILFLLPVLPTRVLTTRSGPKTSAVRKVSGEPKFVESSQAMTRPAARANVRRSSMRLPRPDQWSATEEGTEVLVPPEERYAFAKFVSQVKDRKELVVALVNPAPEEKSKPLKVEALQIASLEIEPLPEPHLSVISER